MFDPNDPTYKKVWAGGVTGGLWYNNDITDEQSPWKNVGDVWENLSVTSIAYDPTDPKIMYVGTGELFSNTRFSGDGIWKTKNGGQSWYQLPSTANFTFQFVRKVIVSRKGTLFASIQSLDYYGDRGILRSEDGGTTWEEVVEGYGCDMELTADGDIIAGVNHQFDGSQIYKSTYDDDGVMGSWENVTPYNLVNYNDRIEIATAPSNNDIYYVLTARDEQVSGARTSSGGEDWENIAIPKYENKPFIGNQGSYNLIALVHPDYDNMLYVGGLYVHRSTDSGDTWKLISVGVHADQHAMAFRPNDKEHYQMAFGNDGGVYFSFNSGVVFDYEFNYVPRNYKYNVTQFYAATLENSEGSNFFIAGSQDNGTQKFTEPGFGKTEEIYSGDGMHCFIDQDDPNIQITTQQYGYARVTVDKGESYSYLDGQPDLFLAPMAYDSKANRLYVGTSGNEIWVSDILADDMSYKKNMAPKVNNITVSPYQNNTVYIASSDAEAYVSIITNAHTNNPSITNITHNLTDEILGVNYVAIGASKNQLLALGRNSLKTIFETNDGGAKWIDKQGNLPKSMVVNWALYNPNDYRQVLLATEAGVWFTSDITINSPKWDCITPNFYTTMLRYREADGLVAIATYGRGLWTSTIFKTDNCRDVYEPNDNWQTNAKPIEEGELIKGTIYKFHDVDYFSFTIDGNPFSPKKDVTVHFENAYSAGWTCN